MSVRLLGAGRYSGMRLLGLFVKAWRPGLVKTRLASTLGPWEAAVLYGRMARLLIHRWRTVADARWLVYTPVDSARLWLKHSGGHWVCCPQAQGDVGDRLAQFFVQARQAGAQRVVAVGSDSPTLPTQWLDRAWQELEQVPVVLGPADDGGYYLIGLNLPLAGLTRTPLTPAPATLCVPDLWHGIPWSTCEVLDATRKRLEQAALPYRLLPTWYDVDQLAGLQRLADELRSDPPKDEAGRRLARCAARLVAAASA